MFNFIDNQLNRITMYRLVLFYLIFLVGTAVLLSFFRVLAYDPFAMLFSTAFLLAACALTNWAFARVFGVPANTESTYISALILALIISPIQSYNDLWFLGWASVLAMASKYILAVKGKHLFNPVALAVTLTYFTINQSASWWIGDARLLPFVVAGGLLVARKIRRFDLALSFLCGALVTLLAASLFTGDFLNTLQRVVFFSPLLFFSFVLITEPLTTPPTRSLRVVYGAVVGFLFTPVIHLGSFFTTPELALLIGNVFSYLVSPKVKLVLRLRQKVQISPDVVEFIFTPPARFNFNPGQYMEWTLGLEDPDSRGNRRYFTLASSPTERDIRLGIKFYQNSSAFKKAMLALDRNQEIIASQLAGDFSLTENPSERCVFIAGGIGITPFRSMLKYLLDSHKRRPITLFYTNRTPADIVYRDILDRAQRELGIRIIYSVTDPSSQVTDRAINVGRITPEWIKKLVPGYQQATYYISGSTGMVISFQTMLRRLGIKDHQIKVDYFAGLS
jgi:ferredoxin-NADP reductase/Na+-translocating ferredoxin:NAD+ oxidoreductase RnfD subunit